MVDLRNCENKILKNKLKIDNPIYNYKYINNIELAWFQRYKIYGILRKREKQT